MPDYQIDVLLAERKSILVSHAAQSLESDAVLVRKWENVPNGFLEDIESEVRGRRTETDPEADLKTFSGTWRIAKVEITRGSQGDRSGSIEETLALGLLTTLPEAEARVAGIDASPQTGAFSLTRAWVYVDPQAADTLVPALNDIQSVTNPKGDGETFTGLFTSGGVAETENDDGSVTVTQTLFKVVRAEDFGDMYALQASDIRTQTEQVHPFDTDGDYGVYDVVQTIERQINTFKNLYVYDRAAIDAFTPSQFTSLAPAGFAFVGKDLSEEDNGTLTLEVTFQDITDKDIYLNHTTRQAALGTATTDVYLEQATDAPLDTSGDTGQGIIVVSDVTRREDGKFDKKKDVNTSVEDGVEFSSNTSTLRSGSEILYENNRAAIVAPPALNAGIYQASQRLNEDGTYSGRLVYDQSEAETVQFRSSSTLFREGKSIVYENSRTSISAPVATGSGIYNVSQRLNEDGTYSGTLVYEEGLSAGEAEFDSRESALSSDKAVIYRSRSAQVDAPTSAQGAVYDVTNSLGDDGLYDARLVYEESISDSVQFRSSSTLFKEGNSIVYENSRTSISAPVATGSGIYSVSQRLNEDGTYSGSLVYEEGLSAGEATFASKRSTLGSNTDWLYKSLTSQIDAPNAELGGNYDVTNTLGDDGLYDARLVYQNSIEKSAGFDSSLTTFRSGKSIVYENSRSLIEPPTSVTGSGIYSVSQRLNDDGTYSGSLVYENGLNDGEAVFASRHSKLSDDNAIVYRSRTTQVNAPGSVLGAVYAATNALGDDGLYDSRLVYEESISEMAQFDSRVTAFVTAEEILYENSRSKITAPSSVTGAGVYNVSQRINEDGTYSGRLVYENGTNAGSAFFMSKEAALSNADTRIYKDSTTQIDVPLSGQGVIYAATNTLTDRGTYDARVVYDVSVEKKASFRSQSTVFAENNSIIYENNRDKISAPPTTAGLYSVTQRINEDGTYSGTLIYQTGLDAGEAKFQSRNSALSDDDSIIYKGRTAQVDAPASGQGAIYNASNSLGEDGLYDSQLVYQESIADKVEFLSSNGPFNASSQILYENNRTLLSAPDATTGLYRVSQRMNEDGTYSGSLTYSTSDNSAAARFPSERSVLREGDSILYRDRDEIITADPAAQAGIYAASNSLNERGLYDGSLVYQTSVPDNIKFTSNSTPFAKSEQIVYENSLEIIQATDPTAGMYRVSQRINTDGTYSGNLVYNSATDGGEARIDSQESSTSIEVDVLYKSTDVPVSVDTSDAAQGLVYTTSNVLGVDGLYDARLLYRASKPLQVEFSSTEGPLNVTEAIVYENNAGQINPPASLDGLYSASNSINPDGTYNGSLTYSKGIPFSTTQTWKSNNRDVTLYMYRNQEDVNIPASSVYHINSLTGLRYKNDGTYDFNFTTANDDKFNDAPTPGAPAFTNSIYLYSGNKRKYYQWNQAWTRQRSLASDFSEGTEGALSYGIKVAGTSLWGEMDKKVTDIQRRGDAWWAGRIEVY